MILITYIILSIIIYLISGCFTSNGVRKPRIFLSAGISGVIVIILGIILIFTGPSEVREETKFKAAHLESGKLITSGRKYTPISTETVKDTITGVETTKKTRHYSRDLGPLTPNFNLEFEITHKYHMTDEVYRSWRSSLEEGD